MAGELIFFAAMADTGLTVTAKVYDGATQVGSDVSCTESGSLAIYVGDMPTASAGTYAVRFVSGGVAVGFGQIAWDGTNEITLQTISAAIDALPAPLTAAEVNAEVDTALADYDAPTKAELDAAFTDANADLVTINEGVKKASLLIPHKTDI